MMARQELARLAVLLADGAAIVAALRINPALVWLLIVVNLAVTASAVHDFTCSKTSGWCVYGLFTSRDNDDRPGTHILYIGKTGDVHRRALQHTEDVDSEPWRRLITHVIVLRCCHSEQQAERIEERRIKALTVARGWNMTGEIHNDLHTRPAPNALASGWRWAWAGVYWVEQILRPALRWIDNTQTYPIPQRPDDEFYETDPPPIDPDADPAPRHRRPPSTEATYERTIQTDHESGWEPPSPIALLAIPPACPPVPRPPNGTPVGGPARDNGTTGQQRDNGRGQATGLADRIRAAQAVPTKAATVKRGKAAKATGAPGSNGGHSPEEREARRRWKEAEKKRSQRARARGEDYQTQPYPG